MSLVRRQELVDAGVVGQGELGSPRRGGSCWFDALIAGAGAPEGTCTRPERSCSSGPMVAPMMTTKPKSPNTANVANFKYLNTPVPFDGCLVVP